jgi:prevent-host-death family protein
VGTITAKQLKQKTGGVLRRVRNGESFMITFRGKAIATLTPATYQGMPEGISPFEEAWADIEKTLDETQPAFKGWREATEWVRNRKPC